LGSSPLLPSSCMGDEPNPAARRLRSDTQSTPNSKLSDSCTSISCASM